MEPCIAHHLDPQHDPANRDRDRPGLNLCWMLVGCGDTALTFDSLQSGMRNPSRFLTSLLALCTLPLLFLILLLRLLRIRHKSSETDLFGAEEAGFRVEMMDCADRRYGDLTLPQVKPPKDQPVQRCYGESPMRVVLACWLRSPILSRSLPFISTVATHRNHQEVFEQGKFGANRSADLSISEFLVNTTTAANDTRLRPLLAYLPRRLVISRYIPASNVARSDEQICL